MQFVLSKPPALSALPAYIPELAHYEWVELALDIADSPQPSPAPPARPLAAPWQRSPLAWCLVYSYPVHLIGPDNPNPAPDTRAYVVYRDANLAVKFMALTLISAQWLQAITPQTTPQQALESLLQGDISGQILEQTQPILLEWIELGVLIPA